MQPHNKNKKIFTIARTGMFGTFIAGCLYASNKKEALKKAKKRFAGSGETVYVFCEGRA